MAFTYSGDPAASELDEVRFTLQDVDTAFPLLTDEEIEYLTAKWLPRYPSLTMVAAIAAATISRKFAGMVTVSVDGVSVDASSLAQRYRDLAMSLREEYKLESVGAEIDLANTQPARFRMGLHDDIAAGLQDFGDFPLTGEPLMAYLDRTGVFP